MNFLIIFSFSSLPLFLLFPCELEKSKIRLKIGSFQHGLLFLIETFWIDWIGSQKTFFLRPFLHILLETAQYWSKWDQKIFNFNLGYFFESKYSESIGLGLKRTIFPSQWRTDWNPSGWVSDERATAEARHLGAGRNIFCRLQHGVFAFPTETLPVERANRSEGQHRSK